jgi:endogenous inhibitor of DNA gyrase (YacG/DUF329 family)
MVSSDPSEFTVPELPPRSTLYCLEPIGIGTPEVESLTGYIARLAEAHCVSIFVLFKYLFGSLLENSTLFDRQRFGMNQQALVVNGTGINSEKVVGALSTLTMQEDLRQLTLLPWGKAFRPLRLLKRERVWCPTCYEEWLTAGKVIYEPLIWTLTPVEICVSHKRKLQANCPHCGKTQPWLANRSRPGHCSRCQRWLGKALLNAHTEASADNSDENRYLDWAAKSIGLMLSAGPRLTFQPTQKDNSESLSACVKSITGGDATAFADLTGTKSGEIRRWLRGQSPLLPTILQICYRADVDIVCYLTGNLDKGKLPKTPKLQANARHRSGDQRRFMPAKYWRSVEKHLAALLGDEKTPPSITEIARKLKIHGVTLHSKLPALCRAIILRRREDQFKTEEACLKAALTTTPPQPLEKICVGMGFASTSQLRKRHPELCKSVSERFRSFKRAGRTGAKKKH